MGPPDRIAQFKAIETSPENDPCLGTPYFGLQQLRWSPELLADTPAEADQTKLRHGHGSPNRTERQHVRCLDRYRFRV
jgi:hypothetical protein